MTFFSRLHRFYRRLVHGPSASGDVFPGLGDPSGDVLVYVYRPANGGWLMNTPAVFLDGNCLGVLLEGGYLVARVAPGVHVLKLDTAEAGRYWKLEVEVREFTVEADERIFFRVSERDTFDIGTMAAYYEGFPQVERMREELALPELRQTRLSK